MKPTATLRRLPDGRFQQLWIRPSEMEWRDYELTEADRMERKAGDEWLLLAPPRWPRVTPMAADRRVLPVGDA